MKSSLSIALFLITLFFIVIAKADEVPPETYTANVYYVTTWPSTGICDSNLFFATSMEAQDYCRPLYLSHVTHYGIMLDWYLYDDTPTSDTYRLHYYTNASQSSSTVMHVNSILSANHEFYTCPSTHPNHVDNNQDGVIDSGDMCASTDCGESGLVGFQGPYWDSQTPSYEVGGSICTSPPNPSQAGLCRHSITEVRQSDWSCEQGQCLYTMKVESTGELCDTGEGVHDTDSEISHDDYDVPEDGDYDETPDTDTDTSDSNDEWGTMDEDLGKIKDLLSEIENSTDDLEGLSKDGNTLADKQLKELKSIDGTLKKILVSDGVRYAGGGGVGSGGTGGNSDQDGSGCPDGHEAECEIRDALTQEPDNLEEDYHTDIGESDIQKIETVEEFGGYRYDIDLGQGSCPANIVIPVFGHSVVINMDLFCQIAYLVKALVIISAWIAAARIYGSIN